MSLSAQVRQIGVSGHGSAAGRAARADVPAAECRARPGLSSLALRTALRSGVVSPLRTRTLKFKPLTVSVTTTPVGYYPKGFNSLATALSTRGMSFAFATLLSIDRTLWRGAGGAGLYSLAIRLQYDGGQTPSIVQIPPWGKGSRFDK